MTAWKDLELRVCRALGGQRSGPLGRNASDCTGVPFAVEIKRSSRPGPPVLAKWILQARNHTIREKRPWIVVVAGHNDRKPVVVLEFWEFVQIAQQAGRIGPVEIQQETAAKPANVPNDRVPPSMRPGGPRRSTTGTATLKGANHMTETKVETEVHTVTDPAPEPEPAPEPDQPDEPDTDTDDDDDDE
jgi:hypothetical protein